MMLDFFKLIELLLPHSLRQTSVLALLRVLVARQLQSLFAEYHVFRQKTKFEASVTPQVCSLQYAIERTFDVNCEITELDGLPTDFLVSIDRSTDLSSIRAFINKHKLAGKSYVFELGDTVFTATWKNYVDEDIVATYTAEWSDYEDEDDGIVTISCFISAFDSDNSKVYVYLASNKALASDILCNIVIKYNTNYEAGIGNVTFASGKVTATATVDVTLPDTASNLQLEVTLDPDSDDTYTYETLIGDSYHL